jgi:glycosyltransferase involved in cell wall biosynthesis
LEATQKYKTQVRFLGGEKMPDNAFVVPLNGGPRMPLVSIIVPAYNCRKFLAEAIESAFAQTYKNIEVVVIDDGSTDGSPAIARSYPVRFVQETHQGVSAARNRGIRESIGEYLIFLDSDDRLLPEAVSAGLAALQQNPLCGMTVGAHNITTQSGESVTTRYKPVPLRDGYRLLLRSNFVECTSSAMFRRSCFSDNAGFRPSLRGAEDYEVYLRSAHAAPMCSHNEIVAEYRLHATNASHNSRVMLTHTLAVHSEQWPFARKSLRYLWAYLYGSLFWRRKYGRQLTVEMAMSELALRPQEDRAAWRLLARTYPPGVLFVLLCRMLPKNLVKFMLQRA